MPSDGARLLLAPLAKVRVAPALRERRMVLVAALEGRVRDLLEEADVVSEGATRAEEGGAVYYGSTHLLLAPTSLGGRFSEADVAALARVAAFDPHLRVRVLRRARGEALSRAGAPLGPLRAEVMIGLSARGLTIRIELSAAVIDERARGRLRK